MAYQKLYRSVFMLFHFRQRRKGKLHIFMAFFSKIGSLVCTQKLGKSVCKKVCLLSLLYLWDTLLCLPWAPKPAPSQSGTALLSTNLLG